MSNGWQEEPEGCSIDFSEEGTVINDDCLTATVQSGNRLVVAGYCLYSAATSFVLSFGGKTCQGFTLDEAVGEFVLTQPNMAIPTRGKPIYSINEANRWAWDPELCPQLLPKFSERIMGMSNLVNCEGVKAALIRSFAKWEANSRFIKFIDSTHAASRTMDYSPASPCASLRSLVPPSSPRVSST